jgi:flagellum-specific peptidoglycan hydrolase FlgJ
MPKIKQKQILKQNFYQKIAIKTILCIFVKLFVIKQCGMKPNPTLFPARLRAEFDLRWQQFEAWFRRRWLPLLGLAVAIWMLTHKDITINFSMARGEDGSWLQQTSSELFYDPLEADDQVAQNVSLVGTATTDRNLTAKEAEKRRKQLAYVKQYKALAAEEMSSEGIPASITLAQALLESNIGESRLARENNNHFGIKCFSKTCAKGHCSNFNDDHHKDFFRIFGSVKESYHAHSKVLDKDRYKPLFRLKKTDYKGWARGLSKAGYATDPRYAQKLIRIIEDLELYQYDY